MTEPAQNYLFDTNNTNTSDPGAAKRLDGYADHAAYPADEHNWLLKCHGDWLHWLHNATKVFGNVWSGAAEVTAGEEFSCRLDQDAWTGVSQQSVAAPGAWAAGATPLACDGDWFAWRDFDNGAGAGDTVRLNRLSVPATLVTFVPAAGVNITSIVMDGTTIWVATAATLYAYDYTGALVSSSALANATLLDCSQGYALTKRGRYAELWDNAATLISTFDCDPGVAGNTISCGRITQFLSPGGDPNPLILWNAAAMGGTPTMDLVRGDTGASLWTKATIAGLAGVLKNCWLTDHGTVIFVAEAGMAPTCVECAFDAVAAPNAIPTGFAIGGMGTTYDLYGASPRFLVCITLGAMNSYLRVFKWDGTDCGQLSFGGGPAYQGIVCDGSEFLVRDLRTADGVSLLSQGRHTARCRRYGVTDWKPFCTALAVEDI